MRSRSFSTLFASAALALGFLAAGGLGACNAVTGIGNLSFDAGTFCKTPADCPAPSSACVSATCVSGQCSTSDLADGTVLETQTKGDCHKRTCKSGAVVDEVDDADTPSVADECDSATCKDGVGSSPPKAAGTACTSNGGKLCDGAGKCVACNGNTDCTGTTNDCQHPACNEHACAPAFTAMGTPTTAQTAGDCLKVECDGAGNTMSVSDDTDTPDDMNDCTTDTCSMGTKVFTPVAAGTACGTMLACDAAGKCDGCTMDAQCTAPQTCGGGNPGTPNVCGCTPTTCAAKNVTCASISDGCGGMLLCDDLAKDGKETDLDCGGPVAGCATRCAQGQQCTVTTDCQLGLSCVDGVCCNSSCIGTCVACSNAKTGQPDGTCSNITAGTDPDNECTDLGPSNCSTNGVCNGTGACATYANGTQCAAPACSGTNPATFTKANTCFNGSCVINGTTTCATGNACQATGSNPGCVTNCTMDTQCQSGYYCTNPTCAQQKGPGSACTAADQCLSGNCVDGVCCNTACTGTCMACDVPGSLGKCIPIPEALNAPDPNGVPACVGPSQACDGSGNCKKAKAVACATNADCASGQCWDGVCCNVNCGAACFACNLPGAIGTCSVLPRNTTDNSPAGICVGAKACDGNGNCEGAIGQACAANAGCASGNCVDGVCCTTAACGVCQSCGVSTSLGTCADLPMLSQDTNSTPLCVGAQACNGHGACLLANGQPCGSPAQCAGGTCFIIPFGGSICE